MCATKDVCQELSQFRKLFLYTEVQSVSGALLCQQPRNFVETQQRP